MATAKIPLLETVCGLSLMLVLQRTQFAVD